MVPLPLHTCEKNNTLQWASLLAAALLLITVLCSPAAAARDVKVALPDLKPTLFTDDQGKPAGFFVDIINDMAAQEGWNVIWVRGSLSESMERLKTGDIDLMTGIAANPDREKVYDFSHESPFSVWSQVYARPGSGINTILDLDGKRVAVVKGDISGIAFRDYAKKFDVNATYVERDIPTDSFAAVAAGEADALVVFNTAGQEDAKTYGLSETPVMFNPTPMSFAVPKGKNADILLALDRYVAEGKGNPSSVYGQAMQKWFGIKADGGIIPPWLWGGLVIAALIAVLFVAMSVLLRRQVRIKTAELARQNKDLQAEIASRRKTEQELADEISRRRILIDQSRDGIVILDQEGKVYEANRRFAEMLGYSREEIQQLHVWEWDVQIKQDQIQEMIRTIDAQGDNFESRHRRKNGSVIDVEISTNAAEFSGRKLIFCIVRDTSERKRAEEQLKTINEYLQSEVANRRKAETELAQKNAELQAAYEQLAATEEYLRQNYEELRMSENALLQARKKLALLNTMTLQDVQTGIFSLAGYIQLAKTGGCSAEAQERLTKGEDILRTVRNSIDFIRKYQDLGIGQPRWQEVNYVLLNAISHLDFSRISRAVDLADLEIYADPMLEHVFFTLMENVLVHGKGATGITIRYRQEADHLTIVVEDNGPGIPAEKKERIFTREFKGLSGTNLFLAREILSITGITIRETGVPGSGARFEITVPAGEYRFGRNGDDRSGSPARAEPT
ncbi:MULTISPECIES: PAS domain S-box protein [unclassified Methanoregula]|uniref:PAS domain S-box protein n=1 Tax=unclassified Methanoregula TaxID=2649730 RepID=UPI0009C8FE6A|nr:MULTISPECIES: transporter substrate-binding domain-containing protein [unclassified Methanoregula]OPX64097.1 MAG: sensory histidine kinase AtoS [Methanoregula sp. PtaB.Bin085]OPY34783.1 MAG: sensory histidine kinase AtoS [Methanoregula sp. PtaU1.Bin006]